MARQLIIADGVLTFAARDADINANFEELYGSILSDEQIQDIVGAMVSANAESGITVEYDDASGKLNFTVAAGNQLTEEQVQDFVGAMVSDNTEGGISVTYDDATGKINFDVTAGSQLTQEQVEDYVGGMISGNTESGITVTYDDATGKLNFTVTAAGGGETNPNIFVPTVATDFSNPNVANANKIWELQADITLTANADLSGVDNIIISDGGGSLILNGFTLTGSNTGFIFQGDKKLIDAFTGTLAGTFDPPRVCSFTNFGAKGNNVVGEDNYQCGLNFLFVRNQKSGVYRFPQGHYHTSVVLWNATIATVPPAGWVIGGGGLVSPEVEMHGAIIQTIPNSLAKSSLFTLFEVFNLKWRGGKLIGDHFTHGNGTDEWPAGLAFGSLAYHSDIRNLDITLFQGDGIVTKSDGQFTNYIKGTSASGYPGVSAMTQGDISIAGTIDAGNANFAHTTNILDVYTGVYATTETRLGYRIMTLTGSSFGGWGGLKYARYWAAFYDAAGVFLEKSQELAYCDYVILKPEWKQCRIIVDMPLDIDTIDIQLRPSLHARGLILDNVNVSYCGRQGASNLPYDCSWTNSDIHDNGEVSPGAGIDIEDERRSARNYHFDNLRMWDNFGGDIIFIGTEKVTITNCKFLPNVRANWGFNDGVAANFARETKVVGNIFQNRTNRLGRNAEFDNNTMIGGVLKYAANGCKIRNNTFYNAKMWMDAFDSSNRTKCIALGNVFQIDRDWTGYLISDRNRGTDFTDTDIILNDPSRMSNLAVASDANVTFAESASIFDPLIPNGSASFGGSLKNFKVKGGFIAQAVHSDYDADTYIPVCDVDGLDIEGSVSFRYGASQDMQIKNSCFNGWLELQFSSFVKTDTTGKKEIVVKDTIVHIKDGAFLWTNTGSFVLDTYAVNVNISFIRCKFINEVVSTHNTGGGTKWMRLNHFGTTLFEDCYFETPDAKIFDLTNINVFTCGKITMIDPVIHSNITFTARATDDILFTKANKHLPVYADDAAAAAANYPSGYMYVTATGEPRIKL